MCNYVVGTGADSVAAVREYGLGSMGLSGGAPLCLYGYVPIPGD